MARPLRSPHRHPPATVAAALELHDRGWAPTAIVRILAGRGITVSISSVQRWVDPDRLERDRQANRDRARERRAELAAQAPEDPYAGMTGLARKLAELEDRVADLEAIVQVVRCAETRAAA